MPRRPYTLLSCAVSADGCLDDASADRLVLSGPQDLDEVDELRAASDAIFVGAGTIRADNPGLLVRSPPAPPAAKPPPGRRTRCASRSRQRAAWIRPPASSPARAHRWSIAPPPPSRRPG